MPQEVILGLLTSEGAARDAIHIAVAPVIAAETLRPGQHIGFVGDGNSLVANLAKTKLGIVDPFLKKPIEKGEGFWMLLYPKSITSLRHVWTHPAFAEETQPLPIRSSTTSESRIAAIANAIDITVSELMESARDWLEGGEYKTQYGTETWRDEFPRYTDEFWIHFEIVTGEKVPEDKRQSFFSCSC
jgi:hypothetical protein